MQQTDDIIGCIVSRRCRVQVVLGGKMPQVLVSRTSGETSRPIPPAQIRLLWVDSPG